jgi:hypothetical protein
MDATVERLHTSSRIQVQSARRDSLIANNLIIGKRSEASDMHATNIEAE